MRLVVLGGSAASTPELFEAIEAWPGGLDRRPALEVVLVGRDPEKLELVAAASRTRLTGAGGPVTVATAVDERAALDGADVVLQQVRVGGLAARAFDESFPWAFGLPGEETMGPGGFANALRTVPAVRETWARIARLAPGALVIDLTNPAGIVAQAARREQPLRLVSVCDAPVTFLDAIGPRLGLERDAAVRRYVGMNHLGWFVPERTSDLDAIADVAAGIDPAVGRLLGAQPTAYVRFYLHPDRMLQAQLGRPTRAEQLLAMQAGMLEAYRTLGAGDMPRRGALWYSIVVVPVIDAWVNGSERPFVLGVRNGTLLPEVPAEATVEVAHRIPAPAALEPLEPPARPPSVAAMLAAHGAYETLAVEAASGGDRAARLRALLANPMVRGYDQAVGLLDAIERGEADGWGPVSSPGPELGQGRELEQRA